MTRLPILVALITLLALRISSASARTVLVAPDGDDGAPGTEASPVRTIQRAATLVAPGDEVIVLPGDYAGFNVEDAHASSDRPLVFRGRPGARIVRPGPMPAMPPINTATATTTWARWPHGISVLRSEHVLVEGFEITGMPGRESDGGVLLHKGGAGIRLEDCRHITVRSNRARDNGRWGIFAAFCDDALIEGNEASGSQLEHGIYLSNSADRMVIRGNRVFGNAMSGIQLNADNNFDSAHYRQWAVADGITTSALVTHNVIWNNGTKGGAAINLDGVSDSIVRGNLLLENHATGIALFQENGATGSQRNQVFENWISMAADARWAIAVLGCAPENRSATVCATANEPLLPTWVRPRALASPSSGNRIRGNVVLTYSAPSGAITVDTPSLEPQGTEPAFTSDGNLITDRFAIDGAVMDLSSWRTRTGQDRSSVAGPTVR